MLDARLRMEFRLLWASLWKRRGAAGLAALAVAIVASVAAALLHVSGDVGVKLSRELRAMGPNLVLAPAVGSATRWLDEGAVRARCEAAGVQGKFWEMYDLLYENQTKWVPEKDLVPVFVDYAKQIGINPDQFMKDLNGETVAQRIFQDGKRAHSFGFKGTPSFVVNGKEATGDQWRPEGLRQMIRDALAASGK